MFSFEEALDYLNSLVNYEKCPILSYDSGLLKPQRVSNLFDLLGNPHQVIKVIHIAGTKGKGSTAAMITSILESNGLRVGLFTSPHLVNPRERIRIGYELIREDEFAQFLFKIKSRLKSSGGKTLLSPTFFEIYTALAFLYFRYCQVNFAVIEVGMGGRLDATNISHSLLEVITPISLDHTRELGNSLVSIAREKAGIIKNKTPVISAPQKKSVSTVIRKICQEKKARLIEVGKDIQFEAGKMNKKGQIFTIKGLRGVYSDLFVPLLGSHQIINAATAIGTIETLQEMGFSISRDSIFNGLRKVKWPGRVQFFDTAPPIIIDSAHNGASANALAKCLRELFSGEAITIILGVLRHKNVQAIARPLFPLARRIILTSVNSPRSLPGKELFSIIREYREDKLIVEKNLVFALRRARSLAGKDNLICITGSVYLAGEALQLISPEFRALALKE